MSRGGARQGGGKRKGQWDRATLENELKAAKQMLEQYQNRESKGHKLAIDILNDVAHAAYGMMAKHQPLEPGKGPAPGQEPSPEKFIEWMRMTKEAAAELAPYQSAKFKSVTLTMERQPGALLPDNAGVVRALTPLDAYRMMRDSSELIDVSPSAQVTALPAPKKAAGG